MYIKTVPCLGLPVETSCKSHRPQQTILQLHLYEHKHLQIIKLHVAVTKLVDNTVI